MSSGRSQRSPEETPSANQKQSVGKALMSQNDIDDIPFRHTTSVGNRV